MKLYQGWVTDEGRSCRITVSDLSASGSEPKELDPRRDIYDHSPTGFAWGYEGSGPAQLALALCADVLGDDRRAQEVYQAVKRTFIDKLDQDRGWLMSGTVLKAIIELCEGNQDL